MTEPAGWAILRITLGIIFLPLATLAVAGFQPDVLISIILTLLGYIPGVIHAFYLLYVYYKRKAMHAHGEIDPRHPPPQPLVWSRYVLRGHMKRSAPGVGLPGPATAGSDQASHDSDHESEEIRCGRCNALTSRSRRPNFRKSTRREEHELDDMSSHQAGSGSRSRGESSSNVNTDPYRSGSIAHGTVLPGNVSVEDPLRSGLAV